MLEKLENNEAVLVMYLADELPPGDRAEVDQMLASDAGLRRDLEQLRMAQDRAFAAIESADSSRESSPIAEAASQRLVMRTMRKWALESPTQLPVARTKGLPFPWWTYPIVASVAIFFAFLAWWGNTNTAPEGPFAQNTAIEVPLDEATANRLDSSMADAEDVLRAQFEAERQIAWVVNPAGDEESALFPAEIQQ